MDSFPQRVGIAVTQQVNRYWKNSADDKEVQEGVVADMV
jgi:hypothetical protein